MLSYISLAYGSIYPFLKQPCPFSGFLNGPNLQGGGMCETFVLIVFFALARLNQQAVLRSCSSTLPWRFDARHMFGTME